MASARILSNMKQSKYDEIAEFAIEHSDGRFFDLDGVRKTVQDFDRVGRLIVVRRNGIVISSCIFDIFDNIADIKEVVIHKDYRNQNLLKLMIIRGLFSYPFIKYIRFRRRKHNNRASFYHYSQFFKGDLHGRQS